MNKPTETITYLTLGELLAQIALLQKIRYLSLSTPTNVSKIEVGPEFMNNLSFLTDDNGKKEHEIEMNRLSNKLEELQVEKSRLEDNLSNVIADIQDCLGKYR